MIEFHPQLLEGRIEYLKVSFWCEECIQFLFVGVESKHALLLILKDVLMSLACQLAPLTQVNIWKT